MAVDAEAGAGSQVVADAEAGARYQLAAEMVSGAGNGVAAETGYQVGAVVPKQEPQVEAEYWAGEMAEKLDS